MSGHMPPSLWAHTAEQAPPTPPAAGSIDADTVIVGGGYCGLSAALHLAEHGAKVVLLESYEPGWGASGRTGGQVITGWKELPDAMERRLGDRGRLLTAIGAGAGKLVFDLIARFGMHCAARQDGWLQAIHGREALEQATDRARQWQARGRPVRITDRAETAALLGSNGYEAGYLDPEGGCLNPVSYARGLARAALVKGAAVHGGSPATSLARDGSGWRVTTAGCEVRAKSLLVATGAYTDALVPGLKRTVLPVQSIQIATGPLPPDLRATILPRGHVASDTRRLLLYFRFNEEGRLIFGGRGSLAGDGIAASHVRAIEQGMKRIFPQVGDVGIDFKWAGQIDITADSRLHVHEIGPNGWVVVGFNGRGVAQATAIGKAVADRIASGRPEDLPLPATPIRPVPLHGLRLPVMAAVASWLRFRDALEARR